VVTYLRMAVLHLPTTFVAIICIQSEVIGSFRNSRWCPVGSPVLELRTKFGSNISYGNWDRRTFVPEVHLMTSRELTSGFEFWSVIVSEWPCCIFPPNLVQIFIQSGDIDIFRNSIWRPPPSWIYMISEFHTFQHDGRLVLQLSTKFNNFKHLL